MNKWDKVAVAQALLKLNLIRSKDAVILDAGSAVTCVADAIFTPGMNVDDLSILTHNYQVFKSVLEIGAGSDILARHEILATGGCYDKVYNGFYGKITESSYATFHPTVVVIGISGLLAGNDTQPGGIYCHAAIETNIKELLSRMRTDRRIIVSDYSKIGRSDSHSFGGLDELLTNAHQVCLVTTRPPEGEDARKYQETLEKLRDLLELWVYEVELNRTAGKEEVIRVNEIARGTRGGPPPPEGLLGWKLSLGG